MVAGPDGPVFDAVSWTDVSWTDVSWDSVSWDRRLLERRLLGFGLLERRLLGPRLLERCLLEDVSWEDAAEGDTLGLDGYELTPTRKRLAASADPDLALPEDDPDPVGRASKPGPADAAGPGFTLLG